MNLPIRNSWCENGFTLVELLVSMVVLGLMAVMATQIINAAATMIGNTGKHLDSDTQARLIFNRMKVDFSKMPKRSDMDYSTFKQPGSILPPEYGSVSQPANLQIGNDQFAFYSETEGYFSGTAQPAGTGRAAVSLVAYRIANDPRGGLPLLQRMAKGLGWEPDLSGARKTATYLPMTLTTQWPTLFRDDPDYKTVGGQVFRMEYTYLLKSTAIQPARLSITPWDTSRVPPHTSINGFEDVAAIVVSIAVLDFASRALVREGAFPAGSLADAKEGEEIASAWNAALHSPGFAAKALIPEAAASSVRIYQRYFYLQPR